MSPPERRVALHVESRADATLAIEVLKSHSIQAAAFHDFGELVRHALQADVILVAAETLTPDNSSHLRTVLNSQEPWSDIPVIVVVSHAFDSIGVESELEALGNVTLLDRPLRVATLLSTIRSALRARDRQYQLRERHLERERDAALIQQSERRYRQLTDLAPDAMFVVQDHYLRYANRATGELLGMAPEYLVGRSTVELGIELGQGPNGGQHEELHWRCQGKMRPIEVGLAAIAWEGRPAIQVVARDVTERKRIEEQLRAAIRSKDEFLALVSHELRTPLTIISGLARFLERNAEPIIDDGGDVYQLLRMNTDRLRSLVENMLLLTHAERKESEVAPIPLAPVIKDAISRHLMQFPARQITFENTSQTAYADANEVWVDQIVTNLLTNAEKYSPAGSPIHIEIREVRDNQLQVSVRDSGEGLLPEEVDSLFDPFFRSSRRQRDQKPGAGLGLAVCKRLIELQGGRIWAAPRQDANGSEFAFELPMSVVPQAV